MIDSVSKPGGVSIRKLLRQGEVILSKAGIDSPKLDARLLLCAVTNLSHAQLISEDKALAGPSIGTEFEKAVERRVNREPVHRIIGYREFYGKCYKLSVDTLEPRPETELLVEKILERVDLDAENVKLLDIGTGTGVIAITLLSERPGLRALATDISQDALETAEENARKLGVHDRIILKCSDMLEAVAGKFDVIVSNPPYIGSADLKDLQPEVREHDPVAALDGGVDGLKFYRTILQQARKFLPPTGRLYLEFGLNQAQPISHIATEYDWYVDEICKDLAGIERVIVLSPTG